MTRPRRARRSRLPVARPASRSSNWSGRRRQDAKVGGPVGGGQARLQRCLDAAEPDTCRVTIDASDDLAHLAIGEDPVVELAPPTMEVRPADQPGDVGEDRPERLAIDRDAAVVGPRTLD